MYCYFIVFDVPMDTCILGGHDKMFTDKMFNDKMFNDNMFTTKCSRQNVHSQNGSRGMVRVRVRFRVRVRVRVKVRVRD